MDTCPVRFEFHCEGTAKELEFIHEVPYGHVTAEAQVAGDAGYRNRFISTVQPIIKEHEAACRNASNPLCGICGSRTVDVLQTPMSWLHNLRDPLLTVWVNGVCGESECKTQMRQRVQDMMGEAIDK